MITRIKNNITRNSLITIDFKYRRDKNMEEYCFCCKHLKFNSEFYCNLDKLTLDEKQINYFYCNNFGVTDNL